MAVGSYNVQQILTLSGVPIRSLRYWIRLKLVPKPIGRGRGARYDDRHLNRVRVILALRSKRLSLDAIRAQLASRTDEEIAQMVPPAPRPTSPDGAPLPPPPPSYPHATWEMVELMEGLYLLVIPERGPVLRRVADDIYRNYAMPRARA